MGTLDRGTSHHTLRPIRKVRKAILLPTHRPAIDGDRLFPASAVISPLLFPYVDRDGLTKPLVQLIAEDAIESGIESIGILASPAVAKQCGLIFRTWEDATALSAMREDWVRLQQEKLATVGERLHFFDDPEAARAFVGDDDFALLPADVLYVSGTKNRCLEQLIDIAAEIDADALVAVEPIMLQQAADATVVQATLISDDRTVYKVAAVTDRPTIDQCRLMYSAGLPPDQLLAATGMAICSSRVLDSLSALQHSTVAAAFSHSLKSHSVYAATISAATFDLRTPYGRLESQLALGLAGVHRFEICEMIARTLAQQAKS